MVEECRESAFTNNAAPQYDASPGTHENVPKAESGMTFTLDSFPIRTIAHWIPASRQVLSDAPMLQGHLESRLLYGLALEEEEQLLTGDGSGANINGLVTQATEYDRGVSNDTKLDCLATKGGKKAWKGDKEFVLDFLETEKVLTVHGSGFGADYGSGHLRVVLLPDIPILETALDRLERFIRARGAQP